MVHITVLTAMAIIAIGAASGVLSALFGVGGAVLTTPGVRVLGLSPIMSVGSTIPAILPGAITGTVRYQREGLGHLAHRARVRMQRCGAGGRPAPRSPTM